MANKKSRVGIGLVAAGAAFGVAAMISAATAPTARADDYTDLVHLVDENLASGQAAFTISSADFGSGDSSDGLAAFFSGVNDDFLSTSNNALAITVEALTGEPLNYGDGEWNLATESDFAQAVADAQYYFADGEGFFSNAASLLSSGDYGGAAFYDGEGLDYTAVVPLEVLILGGVASL
jgi:hypothetical protein